ncbi:MAG: 2-amino-4-hydroxy-6-hydroxymethyldihydropteridine diphosphokinase [Dysgonamonadaceae bacterium]|nr:2-amino-4-hydroxy-6-hydroxymethyldihydropteridine diphosphokinase [Dysgonamonadaceae bacterium]
MKTQHTVYLALGTNLGDKNLNLLKAITMIVEKIGVLSAISSVYETEPWGFESENSFLNMVIKVETELLPLELLHATQDLERKMGRIKKYTSGYRDRIIDIDIIFYDNLIYESEELKLPHPLYKERHFVVEPLKELKAYP